MVSKIYWVITAAVFIFICSAISEPNASADLLCIKKVVQPRGGGNSLRLNGTLKVASSACPRGYAKVLDTSSFKGDDGADGTDGTNGSDGANGSLRIYGDASAGALTVSSSTSITSSANQYTDVTINSGVTLTVGSGTVIRCTGTFTNDGTITVLTYAGGARESVSQSATLTIQATSLAVPGIAQRIPQNGEYGANTVALKGGLGGGAISFFSMRSLLRLPIYGGGGGGGSYGGPVGGSGGGSFTVLCKTAVANTGTITADGSAGFNGGGGGGGGVIILASPGQISNSGTISASGAVGGNSLSSSGAGGGGGGGLIHFISPTITAGTTTVTGGSAGSTSSAASSSIRSGGGGGGASAGAGGDGYTVDTAGNSNAQTSGTAGSVGSTFSSTVDPTSIF